MNSRWLNLPTNIHEYSVAKNCHVPDYFTDKTLPFTGSGTGASRKIAYTTEWWQAPVKDPLSPRESSASDHPVPHVLQAVQNVHLCKSYDLSIPKCLKYLECAYIACQYSNSLVGDVIELTYDMSTSIQFYIGDVIVWYITWVFNKFWSNITLHWCYH